MKSITMLIALVLLALAGRAQSDPEALLRPYLLIKDALVQGAPDAVPRQAAAFRQALAAQAEFPGKATIGRAVETLSRETTLEGQRAAFADLSAQLWPVFRQARSITRDLYYAYCPMRKAWWISAEPEIRNPYYGAKMLACGKIAEKRIN